MSKTYHNNVVSGIQYGLVRPSTSSSSSSSQEGRGRTQFLKDNRCILGVFVSLMLVAGVIIGAIYSGYLPLPVTPVVLNNQGKSQK